jgi:phosphoglycerol transferase
MLLLHLSIAVAFGWWFWRLLAPDPGVPLVYEGDGLVHGALIKDVLETGWYLHNPRLGAPFGSTYYDFPFSDCALFVLIRIIGWFTGNWAVALNIFYGSGFVLTYVTAYWVLRRLAILAPLAALGAVSYTLLPYHFFRLTHLHLAMYFVVPLVVWVAMAFVDHRPEDRRPLLRWLRQHPGHIATAVLAGSCGVYYAFFGALTILASGALEAFRVRLRAPLMRAAALSALVFATVVANVSPTLFYWLANGKNAEVAVRSASASLVYGLNVALMLAPQADHRLPWLRRLAHDITTLQLQINENTSAPLGILMSIGFVILVAAGLGFWWKSHGQQALQRMASLNLVLVLYSTIASFGFVFALLVTPEIRALNRVVVYIAFLSVFAFTFVAQRCLAKVVPRVGFAATCALAVALMAVAWLDQVPVGFSAHRGAVVAQYHRDQAFFGRVEHSVPPGTRVLEFPYVAYPESAPVYHEGYYGMLRGYLQTTALRWSYGAMRGRDDDWIGALARLPVEEQVRLGAASGFGGIYVDGTGYPDGGAGILGRISEAVGAAPVTSEDGTRAFFRLAPTGDSPVELMASVRLGAGFHAWEGGPGNRWAWAGGNGQIVLLNPANRPRRAHLEFAMSTLVPRAVEVIQNGERLDRYALEPSSDTSADLDVLLQPGANRLDFVTDVPAAPPGNGDQRLLSFALKNPTYRLVP